MITGSWTEIAAAAAAFAIATLTAPAGLSGAVLLLPFQVSVLGTPIPDAIGDQIAATPGVRTHPSVRPACSKPFTDIFDSRGMTEVPILFGQSFASLLLPAIFPHFTRVPRRASGVSPVTPYAYDVRDTTPDDQTGR
jgi:hypothetical protein